MRKFTICIWFIGIATFGFAQNIYLLGEPTEPDLKELSQIGSCPMKKKFLSSSKKTIYHSINDLLEFKSSDSRWYKDFRKVWKRYAKSEVIDRQISDDDVDALKRSIEDDNKGRTIYLYDKGGDENDPNTYMDLVSLLGELKDIKPKTWALIIPYRKFKPKVSITSHQSDEISKTNIFKGKITSRNKVNSVRLRFNGEEWQEAKLLNRGKEWEFKANSLKANWNYDLEIEAIDSFGTHSDLINIREIQYQIPGVGFSSPNARQNAVEQGIFNNTYGYMVLLEVDKSIQPNELQITFNASNLPPQTGLLKDKWTKPLTAYGEFLDEVHYPTMPDKKFFCIKFSYLDVSKSLCEMRLWIDYFLEITSTSERQIDLPQKIKIHFGSFDELASYKDLGCQ